QQAMIRYWTAATSLPATAWLRTQTPEPKPKTADTPHPSLRSLSATAIVVAILAATLGWWHWRRAWQQLESSITFKEPLAQLDRASVDNPIRLPGEVVNRLVVHKVEPVYPPQTPESQLGGVVVLETVIATDGTVAHVRPISGSAALTAAAIDAVKWWRFQVEAGGKRLIQITDNGCGMTRDDALLAFERHATSKIQSAEDLLTVATLGFRGEALPSIASVSRLKLETRTLGESSGTILEINGGKIFRVEEAGLPEGTAITVRDLFFNTPARKKFLKAESTELSHIASLVTHYALAHPDKHFELHSATNAILVAPPVADSGQRVYQVFGK